MAHKMIITNGPSRYDLMITLFEGHNLKDGENTVSFTFHSIEDLENEVDEITKSFIIGSRKIGLIYHESVKIIGLEKKDLEGNVWLFKAIGPLNGGQEVILVGEYVLDKKGRLSRTGFFSIQEVIPKKSWGK